MFDENVVRTQLISSGSIAYQQLMRVGFPSHFSIAEIFNMFKENLEFKDYISTHPRNFCNLLLQSCGLKWKDFKLGNTQIFFRSGKFELLSEKLKEDSKLIKQGLDKQKTLKLKLRKKFKAAILATIISARLCVKSRCEKSNDISIEMQPEQTVGIPKKKIRLSKLSQRTSNSASTSTENGGTV